MSRRSSQALVVLLVLVSGSCASTQTETGNPVPSDQPTPTPARTHLPRGYTGLEIRGTARTNAQMEFTAGHPAVREVHPDSPGHQGGFAPGDVIVEVNGRDSREPGATVFMPEVHYTIRIRRGEDERELVLVPGPPWSPGTPSTP